MACIRADRHVQLGKLWSLGRNQERLGKIRRTILEATPTSKPSKQGTIGQSD